MGSEVKLVEGYVSRGGEASWFDPNKLVVVGLDEPETTDNWFAYCSRVDERLDEGFIADIRQRGVVDPVSVCKDGNRYMLLAGRRRVRAARIVRAEQEAAGVPLDKRISVRCLVRQGDAQALFAFNVAENAHRKEMTPLQRARLMLKGRNFGTDDKSIAVMFNCTPQTVKNTLALLDCASEVQHAVESGKLAAHHATSLSKMRREDQKVTLAELVAVGATKGVAASRGIEKARRGERVEKSATKTLSPKALANVREVLSNGKVAKLPVPERVAGEVIAQALAFFDGDRKALDEWPKLKELVVAALPVKGRQKKKVAA